MAKKLVLSALRKACLEALVLTFVALPLFSGGCAGEKVSLQYDTTPGNVVVEVRTSGGLPTPWVDGISEFRLYGDGRVIVRPGGGERKPMSEGKLTPGQVRALLKIIRDTGFFGLKDEYADRKVMDGVTQSITVNLKGEKKEVRVYMEEVKEFDKAKGVIIGYPISNSSDYVPDKGYLLVRKSSQAPTDQPAPPELIALMPPASELQAAAESGRPLEITGEALVSMMRYESAQKYRGLVVKVEGGQLTVYPLYEPDVR